MINCTKQKVQVFAAYQIGTGIHSHMIGDESKIKFEVTLSTTSSMIREIESILTARHTDEDERKLPIIIHHFQLIGF